MALNFLPDIAYSIFWDLNHILGLRVDLYLFWFFINVWIKTKVIIHTNPIFQVFSQKESGTSPQ